jgi:hypothetical protein
MINNKTTLSILLLAIMLIFTASCKRVVIKLEKVPENTPKDQSIYITGNFNNWDPGEEKYIMDLGPDSNYYITLPPGFGWVEYKFSRGDWTTVEKGICGEEIGNRAVNLMDSDTSIAVVESWNDLDPLNCPRLTILLDNVPENTPKEDIIALASNLNSWDPDNASVFERDSSGDLYVTISRPPGVTKLEYKMTRGDLSTSESDEFGNELPNRTIEFGKKDTVKVNIEGWTDMPEAKAKRVVLIINSLPENTPEFSNIYLASNMNSWVAGDKNYLFQLNRNGQLFFPLPRKELLLEYKITRGEWNTVEVDKNGYDIDNRRLDLQNADTINLDILRWQDMGRPGDGEITIVVRNLPASTPDKAKLYISGNFNGWFPGRLRYRFIKDDKGNYMVNLPRRDGEMEFRITRGSWETVEVDRYGSDIQAHIYNYYDVDTLFIDVDNWKDMPIKNIDKVTLIINDIPDKTPPKSDIYLAPSFNGWDPGDEELIFSTFHDGRPIITIPVKGNYLEYKITRGNWETVEVNINKEDIDNRILYYGFADTAYIEVRNWKDL